MWPPASGAPGASASPSAGPSGSGSTPSASFTSFSTVVPPDGDPALLPLLEQHGVVVSSIDTGSMGSSSARPRAASGPCCRCCSSSGSSSTRAAKRSAASRAILGIGRSNARLYNEERPNVTFADVAGEDEAKAELARGRGLPENPDRYQKLGARLPRGVLLVGPPGTGKTLLARSVAGEARVPFFSITASEFVELFVGRRRVARA